MANPASFTDDENWHGWYYELALIFRPVEGRDADQHIVEALTALWEEPALDGFYRDRWSEPEDQPRLPPTLEPIRQPEGSNYGIATLPDGSRVVCSAHIIREGATTDEPGDDWVYLSLLRGSLARIDARVDDYRTEIWPGQDEVVDESRAWREPIDRWFTSVARRVYDRAPFEWGQIGFDITGIEFSVPDDDDHEWMTFLTPSPSGLQVIPPRSWV